ncbi:AMP-binding protein [Novosphingobium sp. G106]|uniref:AMP-binding protein n=1 Tax=Novosphingobium sp. G106 TaxID=2849500 RepID=UPI001C2CDB81|nr:AMP-binding protein [Novosphingobium sp. G106]MBV1688945.1 AMP-binding protein [Novosphingobium sp. G106]
MPGGFRVRWDGDLAARWRKSGAWLDTTLAILMRDLAVAEPDRVLLVEQGREYSAAALYDEAVLLASALRRRGLQPGDVLSYQIPNWYEGSVINVAAALAGLIVNPLVPIYREREVRFMMEDVGTRMVFVPEQFRGHDYAQMFEKVNETLDRPVDIVVLRGSRPSAQSYSELLASGVADDPLPQVDPDSIYVVMHTSGTTGRPKCVVHSHNSFMVQGEAHVIELATSDHEVNLVATPISHIAGIVVANLTPVIGGATVVLMDSWNPAEAVTLVEQYQANSCGGATPFLKGLLEAAKAAGTQLPSLTKAGCGGATVPPELIYQAHEWFPNVVAYRVYGCTEVPTATCGIRSRDDIEYGANTDGLIKHTEVKVVHAVTGAAMPQDQEGEILLRGANMMLGYLRLEDNEEAFDDEGFFRTGDLGRVVDGKYLLITGRKKDLIIRNGENLSPKEIEDALFTHPGISNVAVVGMPSEKTGEAVCAFVVAKPGYQFDLQEVFRHLVEYGLAKQKIPERVVSVESLPVSPQGKILKNELREMAKALVEGSK